MEAEKFGKYSSESWPEDAGVGACEEPCGTQTEVGLAVTVAFGNTFDHSMETQAAEMVSHLAWRQVGWLPAE